MLTGPDFHEEHVLDDGTPVTLRHIRPDDEPELKRGFEHLSAASRYRRFQRSINELSPESLHYLTHVDGRDHVAIVATTSDAEGRTTGLGVARFIRSKDDAARAEVALTVVDEAQRKGLGRILAVAIARAAIERGVHRLNGPILSDNLPIRRLLDEVGATFCSGPDGFSFEIDLAPYTGPDARQRIETVARRFLRAAASAVIPRSRLDKGPRGASGIG